MEYFLERIARSLKDEFGNSLNRHCLVFPGRRAGLYLLRHLAANIEKPVWAPPVYTINELFRFCSGLQPAGSEALLFELYKVYGKLKSNPGSFDDFYFWGDTLINDFDDTDKYLVDAKLLFRNISDLKNIDQEFDSLNESHREIIRRFWLNFDYSHPTEQKEGFINIWSLLNELYTEFRKTLKEKNIAYEGMIFREVAESEQTEALISGNWDMVHFIGFNALNECEKKLMLRLKKVGRARFYWDYDNSYITHGTFNSAGHFMRENLKIFGNDMPGDWSYDTMLSKDSGVVNRQVIETSSDIAQVKLVSDLVEKIPNLTAANSHETAIVLADENLLVPLLTSLPRVDDLNITMGYPLKQSLVYTLLQLIIELQSTAVSLENTARFQCGLARDILAHSLISKLVPDEESAKVQSLLTGAGTWISSDKLPVTGIFPVIFSKVPDPAAFSSYLKNILSAIALSSFSEEEEDPDLISRRNILNEMIYRIVLSLNRLDAVINDPVITFTNETFVKLLERLLRSQSVPFSGEPLTGIQIMGILETRALDFRNLVILSVNEGVMPAISSPSSFIPFSLRGAFGLPSVNHQESIFAYHFYRLLHRAENVTFAYNSNSEGLRNGEMSRFLIQMKYDALLKPEFLNLDFTVRPKSTIPGIVTKNEAHMQKLNSLYLEERRPLSPSAINTWLACRMKFYYKYINGLREPEKSSLENDPAVFGSILHEIMRTLYGNISEELVTMERLDQIIHNPDGLKAVINTAIAQKLNNGDNAEISGTELIIRDVMFAFIQRILKSDRAIAPFRLLHLEHPFSFVLQLDNGLAVRTGGIADRIDIAGGKTRIVDYKTGNISESAGSISELFENDRNKDHDGWLQALIYCEAYLSINKDAAVRPSIYAIKKMTGRNHSDLLKIKADRKEFPVEDYLSVRQEFLSGLKGLIAQIFSPDEHFSMSDDTRGKCRYCSYRRLCLR